MPPISGVDALTPRAATSRTHLWSLTILAYPSISFDQKQPACAQCTSGASGKPSLSNHSWLTPNQRIFWTTQILQVEAVSMTAVSPATTSKQASPWGAQPLSHVCQWLYLKDQVVYVIQCMRCQIPYIQCTYVGKTHNCLHTSTWMETTYTGGHTQLSQSARYPLPGRPKHCHDWSYEESWQIWHCTWGRLYTGLNNCSCCIWEALIWVYKLSPLLLISLHTIMYKLHASLPAHILHTSCQGRTCLINIKTSYVLQMKTMRLI